MSVKKEFTVVTFSGLGVVAAQTCGMHLISLVQFHQWHHLPALFSSLDLLTVTPHTPTPEPVKYDKTDGQWYIQDGVDVKETQQRKGTCRTCTFRE